MPIYEFYCPQCHVVFNFFSPRVNTTKRPSCPRCGRMGLERHMSAFAVGGRYSGDDEPNPAGLDEQRLESAMTTLAGEMDHLDENDPRQAAQLMRRLTHMTGMELGDAMEEALRRMEKGEDPEVIESEMGTLLESEDPFQLKERQAKGGRRKAPAVDETLYEL